MKIVSNVYLNAVKLPEVDSHQEMSGDSMFSAGQPLRVVIFSWADSTSLGRLATRIQDEVPEARVCGIIREQRKEKSLWNRTGSFLRNLRKPDFLPYAAQRIRQVFTQYLSSCATVLLRVIHGLPKVPTLREDFASICVRLNCAFLQTNDFHSDETLRYVRSLQPDLGIVYGTGILKPELFAIPKLGSINIHKRKVPDYRGGGPVGLWELLDGQREIGVTVHQVTEKLDAGAIVNTATIPIESFDTLTSLALKAHVVGNDLIVRSVAEFARGNVRLSPQEGAGRLFKNPRPQQLHRYIKELRARRPVCRPVRTRPRYKLLARSLVALPIVLIRNWLRRWRGSYPVTILYHHLVSDRPHGMGIPTDLFFSQVQYLKKHYKIVSLSDAMEMLRANKVDSPSVVLTFDDGYRDNYINIRAVTEQLRVPVAFFVCTDHVASEAEFSHDTARGCHGFLPLKWDQVQHLSREGFEIGSHTRTHFDCRSQDRSCLEREIVTSKRELERRLGRRVRFFAFPWGLRKNMSPEAIELAKETYDCVFSAYGGVNFADGSNPCQLLRCPHMNDSWELELQLQSFLEMGEGRIRAFLEWIRSPHQKMSPESRHGSSVL